MSGQVPEEWWAWYLALPCETCEECLTGTCAAYEIAAANEPKPEKCIPVFRLGVAEAAGGES